MTVKRQLPPPEALRPRWLETTADLVEWLDELAPGEPVAIDSEFERTRTFYARPGLVQIATDRDGCLVEPEVIESCRAFHDFLADPERQKLLYAMSEDLDLFREWLKVEPAGVIDLQIGAALAGDGLSTGFARIIASRFDIVLDKELTRSDWLARPLSPAQQQYALADVYYLLPLHEQLMQTLEACGLREALYEESETFAREQLRQQREIDEYYLRLRGGWKLGPQQQQVLRALCIWRERLCRHLDRPRSRVVADKLLLAIADTLPRTRPSLARVEGMPPVVVRKHAKTILEIIEQELASPESDPVLIEPPLSREEQACYRSLKAALEKALHGMPVPTELLAPRRRLEPGVREGLRRSEVPQFLREGWRGRLLADHIGQLESLFR